VDSLRFGATMVNYKQIFTDAICELRSEKRYRVFAEIERIAGDFPHAVWHSPNGRRDVVIWCSNDYLGMGQHPKVIDAMVETAMRMGAGAGGTRNIAGTNRALIELERELADLHHKEAALVLTSAYSTPTPAVQPKLLEFAFVTPSDAVPPAAVVVVSAELLCPTQAPPPLP
jgi:7-keto-8-aminopelargonate synthetase-like enzyme